MNMLKFLENLGHNKNVAQKIVITVWLILMALSFTQFTGGSSDDPLLMFLVAICIIAFILFKVWADKKGTE